MTTGNRTMNGRYTVMGLNGGSGGKTSLITVGRYFQRSWSGTNAVPSTVKVVRKGPKSPRKNHMILKPNPYRVDWDEETRGLYRVYPKAGDPITNPIDITVSGFTTPFPTLDPRQLYKLIAKLQRRVYGSDFHPAASLAEGFKAIDMIYNAAVRIGASIAAVTTRDFRGLKRALPWLAPHTMRSVAKAGRSTSQLVLEIQYGWRPLMADAHDAGEWFAASMDQTNRSRENYSVSRAWQVTQKVNTGTYGSPFAVLGEEITMFKARYQVLTNSIQASYLPTMWSFAEAAWEVTPYSFIGDWFVPIQSYLNSMNTLTGIVGTHILSVKAEKIGQGIAINKDRTASISGLIGSSRQVTGYMYREVSTSPIVPKPVDVNSVGKALSHERTVNAIALLGSKAWSALLAELYQHPATSGRLRA